MWKFWKQGIAVLALAATVGPWWVSATLAGKPGGGGTTAPYTLVDLLAIPGDAYGRLQSDAVALSEPDAAGDVLVVGESCIRLEPQSEGEFHPAFWSVSPDGSFPMDQIDLGMIPPGAIASRASDVNDLGMITINANTGGGSEAWLLGPGLPQQLPGDSWWVGALNNCGEIVGMIGNGGALWQLDAEGLAGEPISLGNFFPYDINDEGVMAGEQAGEAAIAWLDAAGLHVQQLGVLPGYSGSQARAISENGMWVAGTSLGPNGGQAFLWSAGTGMEGLGTLGGNGSYAYGVNNAGQVVGDSETADPIHQYGPFLWQNGKMSDLNSLVGFSRKSKIHLSTARDINDAGQIVGVMRIDYRNDSEDHGFLLIKN